MPTVKAEISHPPHVDPTWIVDYDMYDDPRHEAAGDLHLALHKMAEDERRGVFWTPHNGGHWVINDYDLLFDAARNPELFSSASITLPPLDPPPRVIPVGLDPPVHGKYRLPLIQAFSPVKINAMEGQIRAFANELIDRVAANGECDFVDAISSPLPVVIFMRFMGMDIARRDEFREWAADMLSNDDPRRFASHVRITEMMSELIAARRIKREDDLVSRMIDSEIDGRPISTEDLLGYFLLLFGAGLDTVANAIAFTMNYLAVHPDLGDRLRAEPSLIPDAVEEFLRVFGVANIIRIVTRDAEFGGVKLKAGDHVLLMLAAGNNDPRKFRDPLRFDLDRENKTHINFGAGPHRCVGSHLARLELRIFLEVWLKRMPKVSLAPGRTAAPRGGPTLALKNLPLVWNPEEVLCVAQ